MVIPLIPVTSLLLALTLAAPADSRRALDMRAQEARKACAAGQVERGIQLLADLIAENGDPNALYNQARCYQQNGRAEEAISRFREYLRVAKGVPPDESRTIEGYIKELEAELDAEARRAKGAGEPIRLSPPQGEIRGPGAAPGPGASLPGGEPDRSPDTRRSLRIASLALGVASVAALGAGIYFALRVDSLNDAIADQNVQIAPATYAEWESEGRRAEVLQWVGLGVSAGALAGAITCHLLGRAPSENAVARGPRLVPIVQATGGGAALRLAF